MKMEPFKSVKQAAWFKYNKPGIYYGRLKKEGMLSMCKGKGSKKPKSKGKGKK